MHAGLDLLNPPRSGVVHGTATEGGETGAEDHAGIEEVGIVHHTFAQAGSGFIEHAVDEPFLQFS